MKKQTAIDFDSAFKSLTGNDPFPWQRELYDSWFSQGKFPASCNLPTGLGKTAVVAIWLIALAKGAMVPRRLVYVVNRRTVVDQTTAEVEKLRENLSKLDHLPAHVKQLAISTLRGQYADNREWSADPARPAVICGTVDMIGSRLLFSGYGVGWKAKPLQAGFLGQDVLLIHDEAHLEPAFQKLLVAIQHEQRRSGEFKTFRVVELSATSSTGGTPFELTPQDRANKEVKKRIAATKAIHLHENKDEKKLADELADLALKHEASNVAVLVFVRKVDDLDRIVKKLPKERTTVLTGTMRGKEREELVAGPIFKRFLPKAGTGDQTVYLVCTSAGEVGVNISADHLVCDLSTFDSMAQRFGRVNRFGDRDDTRIDIVHPTTFDESDRVESRLKATLALLSQLAGDGSPKALGDLDPKERLSAFAPQPIVLPVSDILFDAWSLTTIRGKLPGRPDVEPYLHGVREWEPPETHVAWREEVGVVTGDLRNEHPPEHLLEEYPIKPHELLRDNTNRVFDRLKKLKAPAETPVWIVALDESVKVTTLGEVIESGKDELNGVIVLLPPSAGGLQNGMLSSDSTEAKEVADEWRNENGEQRRARAWTKEKELLETLDRNMRHIRTIEVRSDEGDDGDDVPAWHWYELPKAGDTDGSKTFKKDVTWEGHTADVVRHARAIVGNTDLPEEMQKAIIFAAEHHDLGKRRAIFQRALGNSDPSKMLLAKSGRKARETSDFRHEFGSLLDLLDDAQAFKASYEQHSAEMQTLILHLIAVHHGHGRPHFEAKFAFDPGHPLSRAEELAAGIPLRFARLQRKYGRWGLAYLESLLRAADWAASAKPETGIVEDNK